MGLVRCCNAAMKMCQGDYDERDGEEESTDACGYSGA